MDRISRPQKRPRNFNLQEGTEDADLSALVSFRLWERALERARKFPEEVSSPRDPSPLALACRQGAPYNFVQEILCACPQKLRHLLDSRGTPLHEAIVCNEAGPDVISLLLKADEELGSQTQRAAIMQDVDGYTPLHLLIRRRFQPHVEGSQERSHLMEILEMLVKSCPDAVVVPDRGEYEEPPIVMALKANVYAPALQREDSTAARIERNIYEMVNCMLNHYPKAASCVFNGYRGQYTALHSAVFHGRCPDTLELLLKAEKRCPSSKKAGLLSNTQGEMPLHFCAMRGEPPRSLALLASGAPEAVTKRDASGLTPIHWLWIRFVSTLLAFHDEGRENSVTIPLQAADDLDTYSYFASIEQGNYESDIFVRRVDPPVDFLRMRHIPSEVIEESEALQWAERTVNLLKHIRERHDVLSASASESGEQITVAWSRIEAIAGLFWTKVVSLLKATANSETKLVQIAFENTSCPPQVARIVASLHPEELVQEDLTGRLPLHHAAARPWHAWDWPRDGSNDASNAQLLELESACLLRTALSLSPVQAARHKDGSGYLPIHYAIPTFVRSFSSSGRSYTESAVKDTLDLVRTFVQMNPNSLHERDPSTGLYPFLQATAVATEEANNSSSGSFPEEFSLSVVYLLLHENPSLVEQKM